MRRLLVSIIRIYQNYLSPFLAPSCRFYPSCSAYSAEAVARHGAGKGLMMSLRRISHCHPGHAGGYDPVPDSDQSCPGNG